MMLNVLWSIFIWFKLSLNKFLMCKKICLLTMPNRIYRPSGLKPEEELALKILSIQKGIRRESSKIIKCRKMKLLVLRRRRRRSTKKLTIPMIQIVYLPPMLRLKTMLNRKRVLTRMIHPKSENKKHQINARNTLEKTSSQEYMGRKENHGYRNPCPFQVSPSNLKKKSITISFVSGLSLFFFKSLWLMLLSYLLIRNI